MSDIIRISAKNLSTLALPGVCPRCFWLKLKYSQTTWLPFHIFPDIFSSIDVFTKSIVHAYFDELDEPPLWLSDLGPILGYREPPHFSQFDYVDTEHNILPTLERDARHTKCNL